VRQCARLITLDGERFKREVTGIRSLREIAWQIDRNLHGSSVAESGAIDLLQAVIGSIALWGSRWCAANDAMRE
jgi:hypothetical protein